MFSCSQDSNRCFFSSLLQRIGLSEFSEKKYLCKKKIQEKKVFICSQFLFFACHFALSLPFFSFLFLFF